MAIILPLFFCFVIIASTLLVLHCPLCSILVPVPHFIMCHIRHHIRAKFLHHFLIGSTKIAFVSYVYSINMYCIPLLLVTVKHPVKSVHIFPVSGFASPIAANTTLLFSYLLGDKYVSVSSANCTIFLILCFSLFYRNVQKYSLLVLEGVQKLILCWDLAMLQSFHSLTPWLKMILQGWNMLYVKNLLTLLGFSSRKHFPLVFFVVHFFIFILNW